MKKMFAAMMVLVILVMGITAQGEVCISNFGYQGPADAEGNSRPEKWVVYYKLDHSEEELAVEVSQQDYNRIVAAYENEKKLAKAEHESLWYIKAANWVCDAGNDIADFVVFWD